MPAKTSTDEVTIDTPTAPNAVTISEQDLRLVTADKRVFEVPMGSMTIGTAADCTIQLDDTTVSRRHCRIERTETTIRVEDLGSTNGTDIDGVAIHTAFLRPGSRLRVGTVQFVLDVAYSPLSQQDPTAQRGFRGLAGKSAAMQGLFNARVRLANSDVTVLIQGETGTGKSVLARSIHMASARREKPFIVLDCSAVAPSLVDAALFGHEKGAFTGADVARIGALEAAADGTIFIDELTELSAEVQPKLLRAIEERVVKPLGSNATRPVKCRIIAASQHNLRQWVDEGKFRRDLYYRLAVVVVPLPPLRERREDIPLIVEQLMYAMDGSMTPFASMPEEAQKTILSHPWPGNIRELRNYLERMTVMQDYSVMSDTAGTAGAPNTQNLDAPFRELKEALIQDFEGRYLARLLERADYNINEAARLSRVNRRHLQDLLMKYKLDKRTLLRR